jgi:hypothetical protein
MPNTTPWYEITGNFSPYFTRIYGKFFSSFYSYLLLRQFVVDTRIMKSKISGNFVPSRCTTNENRTTLKNSQQKNRIQCRFYNNVEISWKFFAPS